MKNIEVMIVFLNPNIVDDKDGSIELYSQMSDRLKVFSTKVFEESFEEKYLFLNPMLANYINVGDLVTLDDIENNPNFGLIWNTSEWAKNNAVMQAINHDIKIPGLGFLNNAGGYDEGYVFGGDTIKIKIISKTIDFNMKNMQIKFNAIFTDRYF